jgi:N-acetylglucosaminyl-diphospho-decaprenol L-rhamnosyltransferase
MHTPALTDLTISIVSHGHRNHVLRLLQDLNRIASTRPLKVLLTLNVPEPESGLTAFSSLNVALSPNSQPKGFAANHNAAFVHCNTSWFAVLNPDVRLPNNPFTALLEVGNGDPRIALLAPRVVNSVGKLEDHIRPNLTPLSLWRRRRGIVETIDASMPAHRSRCFYWFAGMFMLFRSEAFRSIGGFDERFFLYCEDYDICARLFLSGHALALVPYVEVVHDAQRESHRSFKHRRWHIYSLLRVWSSTTYWRILSER